MEAPNNHIPVEVGDLDPRFECPICLGCLKDPVQTICGHRFCSTCIQDWLENKSSCCPVDSAPLQNTNIFPDNYTRREILGQRTMCRICSREISLTELEDHATTHESEKHCLFRSIGCKAEIEEGKLAEHLDVQIHQHLYLMRDCYMKIKESVEMDDVRSRSLPQEAEMWEPSDKTKPEESSLLKALYERVVVLEQRAHEQGSQIERLKKDLSTVSEQYNELSLLHCNGQFLWRVNDWKDVLDKMKARVQSPWLRSPGFYTSAVGYKFCGRLNISPEDESQLTLVVHIMQTPHDAALDWPFSGRIQLAVVHPTRPELTVKETMISRPELEAFRRPRGEINRRAFGYLQFVSINDILNGGYLDNGTLLVKINVQCV